MREVGYYQALRAAVPLFTKCREGRISRNSIRAVSGYAEVTRQREAYPEER
jgi:hypothetical protein